ncbi:PTS system mannitol-specific IIA component/PTS system ascorbate-specific IIA component [Salirhabdus euzebyi]|uniref:PTS system mannitol-specific IIA component/PTS system ascorbate-specific IIA component n=1 Tax=Salirhabdus euzebyi TaxID=394506 RepID=A0A841Q5M9_9BACI|nr:PTS sugar transporter subunit IIA [Salirhabdus euzebyi]MBB6453701.1 PTS system mannitol-specific IIA component/PTS system ascorbate-specific IIA component [Salirhabdus euzebyi]
MKFLEESLIALDVDIDTPEGAIRETGKLLSASHLVEESYVDAMVKSFNENGPYFVLAPNIALPHARPEDGVHEAAVSFVRLKNPVKFGHASNDPVQLVFGLGASSSDEHLTVLQRLMGLLGNPDNVEKLLHVKTHEEINQMIGGN